MNHPIMFLDRDKTKLLFSCFLELLWEKKPVIIYLHYEETNWIVLFTLLLQKVVEKSNSKNLKVIKNTLPNKSWNPEDLKNNHSHCVKVSKYGVISGPYFPVFSPNTGKYGPEVTVFGHFSSSEQLESSSANINIFGEDLLRTFYKFFCLWFLVF